MADRTQFIEALDKVMLALEGLRQVCVREQARVQKNFAFQNSCDIDVTYFDVNTPDDPLGYLCSGIVRLSSDGDIIVYNEKRILESFNLTDVISATDNINNYDPKLITAVKFMTNEKSICLSFQSIEIKKEFWNAAAKVYGSLKIEK